MEIHNYGVLSPLALHITRPRRIKMSSSAKLKEFMLRYPTAWRDFRFRNTMSTGKLKNLKFQVFNFWGEKRHTKNLRTVFQLCWDQLWEGVFCVVHPTNCFQLVPILVSNLMSIIKNDYLHDMVHCLNQHIAWLSSLVVVLCYHFEKLASP